MNTNSIVIAVFKPALRKKLEFKELHSVTFKANKITDTLEMSGMGTTKENFNAHERNCQTLKLSENGEFVDLFLKQVKDKAEFKDLHAANIVIDFNSKKCISTLYYLNSNNVKCKKDIEITF